MDSQGLLEEMVIEYLDAIPIVKCLESEILLGRRVNIISANPSQWLKIEDMGGKRGRCVFAVGSGDWTSKSHKQVRQFNCSVTVADLLFSSSTMVL